MPDAPPAELWSAWTEPERTARWLGVIDGHREWALPSS
jgi:uncharacterized protein YndB with AHSA1/START domain